ncbi:MAG: hypothetical protein ACYC23_20215 [Limisphaerales bacterium]
MSARLREQPLSRTALMMARKSSRPEMVAAGQHQGGHPDAEHREKVFGIRFQGELRGGWFLASCLLAS